MATRPPQRVGLDRRAFLAAAGAGFLASLAPGSAAALEASSELFASACRKPDGGYAIAIFTERGEVVRVTDLPARGHDVVADPANGRLVAFARRPGTFAVVTSPRGETVRTIVAAPGRHFYGHGVFSRDGRLLYATENDYDGVRGVIGVYDTTAGYRRIGEIESGGVGPHEAALAPDGRTLVVANGGIETHPDYPRAKLNLGSMQPSITLIDTETGSILETHVLPADRRRLSIRHLDMDENGHVWFGCQWQDTAMAAVQPVGVLRRGEPARLITLPDKAAFALRNYVSSVAASRAGDRIAVSSSVGHTVAILDAATGALVSLEDHRTASGITAARDGLVVTTGDGRVIPPSGMPVTTALQFDNHAARIDIDVP